MKFFIEQIAICPPDPELAMQLLAEIGAVDWTKDHVTAAGIVRGLDNCINEADLNFNYEIGEVEASSGRFGIEFEVLHYTKGRNWMESRWPSVSHLGMHVPSAIEMDQWKAFFAERKIEIAQEVVTQSHSNPAIAGKRRYNYVIFDTRSILGVDLKFILRLEDHKA